MQTDAGGTWRLRFYDVWGEDWITDPITFNADCTLLEDTLKAIPNDVISSLAVTCTKTSGQDSVTSNYWVKYELKFIGNPGAHRVPEVVVLDDAGRHTLRDDVSAGVEYNGLDKAVVYDTGITGEFYDFFGKKCGVTVTILDPVTFYESVVADGGYAVANGDLEVHYGEVQRAVLGSVGTLRDLKECLSDSDGVPSNNVGVENWDFGNELGDFGPADHSQAAGVIQQSVPGQFPHLVKLVSTTPDSEYEGGVYTIMTWHPDDDNFVLSAAVDMTKEYQVCCVVRFMPLCTSFLTLKPL